MLFSFGRESTLMLAIMSVVLVMYAYGSCKFDVCVGNNVRFRYAFLIKAKYV